MIAPSISLDVPKREAPLAVVLLLVLVAVPPPPPALLAAALGHQVQQEEQEEDRGGAAPAAEAGQQAETHLERKLEKQREQCSSYARRKMRTKCVMAAPIFYTGWLATTCTACALGTK